MNFRKHLFSGIVLQGIGLSLFAQTDKPNIVVIMTDQQRADLCGREGFPMDITPFVDELAHQNAWFDKKKKTNQNTNTKNQKNQPNSNCNSCTYQSQCA